MDDLVSFGSGGVWNERLLKDPQFDCEKVLLALNRMKIYACGFE